MNFCTSSIIVTELFDLEDMVSRTLADELFDHILARPCPEITVDFSGISTISRAFADQFHKNKLEAISIGKVVIPDNMNDYIRAMFKAVVNTQDNANRKYESTPIFEFRNRKEMKEFLLSF